MTVQIRPVRPADYRPVIAVINDWWGGRQMADMLPRLFFEHFTDTCFAAERDGEIAGFLIGFRSQSRPAEAYIHFVGVHPAERGSGLGRRLYERFFAAVRAQRCDLVRAVTSPVNHGSIRFHRQMGFDIEPGDAEVDGIPVTTGYDGDGQDRVRFVRHLAALRGPGGDEATVKSHIARILAKLGLRDRVQVAVFAYENGIVRPGRSVPGTPA